MKLMSKHDKPHLMLNCIENWRNMMESLHRTNNPNHNSLIPNKNSLIHLLQNTNLPNNNSLIHRPTIRHQPNTPAQLDEDNIHRIVSCYRSNHPQGAAAL